MASRVEHIARFAVQDWRTSKVRARSARTQDPMLRTVYLELLFALYEAGGRLPADPECLADTLLLPAEDVARCLPILLQIGQNGRGGLAQDGEEIHNLRVDEDLAAAAAFREVQRRKGQARHQPRLNTGSAAAERRLNPAQPIPKPLPLPKEERSCARVDGATPLSRLPAGFQEFWDAYPSKVAKGAAVKAWEKTRHKRPPLPDLLAAVERYRTSEKVAEGFVANPSTWLTQERWTDAPPPGRLNLQPRQNGNGPPLEQYRLQILDQLNRLRKDRGESWYDQVAEDVHRAKTKDDLEALLQ